MTDPRWQIVQAKMDSAAENGWRLFVRRPGEAAREVPLTVEALFEEMGPEPRRGETTAIEVVWRRAALGGEE